MFFICKGFEWILENPCKKILHIENSRSLRVIFVPQKSISLSLSFTMAVLLSGSTNFYIPCAYLHVVSNLPSFETTFTSGVTELELQVTHHRRLDTVMWHMCAGEFIRGVPY